MTESVSRFDVRVPYYHKFRPRYPAGLTALLTREIGLSPDWIVADIGAGTGISSEPFLALGCTVHAIEPNAGMRAAASEFQAGYPNFIPSEGKAEATGLPDASVNLVTAGQAFHWFDFAAARTEFQRILKPNGWVVLFWNDRVDDASDFVRDFNAALDAYDLDKVISPRAKDLLLGSADGNIEQFYAPGGGYVKHTIPNPVTYDWDGLLGRAISASYCPLPGNPQHNAMKTSLRSVFDRYQSGGLVRMDYVTQVYIGNMG
jgi:SAM-dependent methyltransferase